MSVTGRYIADLSLLAHHVPQPMEDYMADDEQKTETKKESKPKAPPLVKQNGITQPRPGGKTRMVWDCADHLAKQLGRAPALDEVRNEIYGYNKGVSDPADAIGKGTIDTQYLAWRKFHNIAAQGRPPKPETQQEPETEQAAS